MPADYTFDKKSIIETAKDLCYPKKVITLLENATNVSEMTRIMITARKSL